MPTINFLDTKECEWSDQTVYVDGVRIRKITGTRFGVEKDLEEVMGEGDDALFLNSGNRKKSGEIKCLMGAIMDLNLAAVAATGRDLLDLELDIVIKYKAKGARRLQVVTLVGVQFSKFDFGWDQGASKMEVTLPFKFLRAIAA